MSDAKRDEAEQFKAELVALMPSLRAFARTLCGNPTRADDLVQDTLVKALSNLDRFEVGTNLRAWLFTILRNTFCTGLRKRSREVEDPEGVLAGKLSTGPNQPGALDYEDFKVAFAKLSLDHREALTLVGAFGLSYEEAAEICSCAVGTIKSRVNRGRAKLAELLASEPPDPAGRPSGDPALEGVASGQE